MSILIKKFQTGNRVDLLTKTNQFIPNNIKPDTIINDGYVKEIPVNYNKESEEVVGNKIRTYYSTQANEPKVSVVPPKNKIIPATNVTPNPEAYKKIIQDRLNKGEKLQDLINKGVVSVEGAKQFIQPFEVKRKVYTETEIPVVTKPAAVADSSRTPAQMVQDRKQVFGNKTFESFDYPDAHAGYSQSTRVHFDPTTKKEIDPIKSFDEKGNYKPFFIENSGRDYYQNTRKFAIPGTNSDAKNLDINKTPVETGYRTTAYKKGGIIGCKCGGMLYKKKQVDGKLLKYQTGGKISRDSTTIADDRIGAYTGKSGIGDTYIDKLYGGYYGSNAFLKNNMDNKGYMKGLDGATNHVKNRIVLSNKQVEEIAKHMNHLENNYDASDSYKNIKTIYDTLSKYDKERIDKSRNYSANK